MTARNGLKRLALVLSAARDQCRAPLVFGLVLLGSASVAAADPGEGTALLAKLSGLLAQYSAQGDFRLPEVSTEELHTLATGESVVIPFDAPGAARADRIDAMRALGLSVIDAPRLLVWLSLLDAGSEDHQGRLQWSTLSRMPSGGYVRYQHMDLPWPFKARQWVIDCDKNVGLAARSDGRIWEHRWSLHPEGAELLASAYDEGRLDGFARRTLDDAVYLPANRGAWILFDLGRRTLAAAVLDVDFGGHFPRGLVRMFAKRQLRASLESLEASSRRAYLAYDEQPIVYDGYGQPISRRQAVEAALGSREDPLLVGVSFSGRSQQIR